MKDFVKNRLKYWYLPLLFGIISVFLGFMAFRTPLVTFLALSVFFAYGFMFSGLLEAIHAISNRKHLDSWGWYLALGIVTFILGIQLIFRLDLSLLILSFYIGFWLLFRSVTYISSAIDLKRLGSNNWGWVLFFGILGVIASFFLLWNPLVTSIATSIWIGTGLICLGFVQIILAFSLRRIKKEIKSEQDNIQTF